MPNVRGRPTCSCMAEWFYEFEKECIRRGYVKRTVDIYQLIGNAPKSAGFHRSGAAADFKQAGPGFIRLARNMGAAAWRRDGRDGMIVHTHLVLNGCPHLTSGAKTQIGSCNRGDAGLVGNARDRGPRDGVQFPLRTWREGIKWAKSLQEESAPVKPQPKPDTVTLLDSGYWNTAWPGWFTKEPWSSRGPKIGATMASMDCSIWCCGETKSAYQTKTILKELGSNFTHVSSPIGNDIFFDHKKYDQTRDYHEYSLETNNRFAGVLHLKRLDSGHNLSVVNTHFPNGSASRRTIASRELVQLLADVDDPVILTGDFNNQAFNPGTPHQILSDAGYEWLREQTKSVTNGNQPEFPAKGMWLSDIATKPSRKGTRAKLLKGELKLTSAQLSDHRPIKARVEIR